VTRREGLIFPAARTPAELDGFAGDLLAY